jgi:hypothetical protein
MIAAAATMGPLTVGVAVVVAVAMVLGAVDLLRQPGWAWKAASEPKLQCLGLIILLPGVGLAIYVFGARPKVIEVAAAGRAANLPFERFQYRDTADADSTRSIQALSAPTALGSFGERRPSPPIRASDQVPAGGGFFDDPDVLTPTGAGGAAPTGESVDAGAVMTTTAPTEIRIPGGLGRPYNPKQRTSFDESGAMASVGAVQAAAGPVPVPSAGTGTVGLGVPMATPGSPEIFRPRPAAVTPLAEPERVEAPRATMAARWMPDPTGRHQYRYWDGGHWTENVYDAGVETRDPVRS